ncbi:MAG: tRNA (adenosine(37)-N6)-threonylcarbamoyltransferase complex ATPase subunit type 1 TsaE [Candidatus Aenigmarchaeota archaeon]|nr:tRNA (adenosine(37)-N6)-threonylcarbamoyltransferase complex ATPase subunit type 1 TsaE [Candidatus Aenigmarchaeota archaeon]
MNKQFNLRKQEFSRTHFRFISENLSDTKKLAWNLFQVLNSSAKQELLCNSFSHGILICLYGDIGSGKTAFVKYLAEFLGIKEKITSPSFVILNEYHSDAKMSLYHFDLYRLEKGGIDTILDELAEYSEKENSITVIEWAEFSPDNLPEKRIDIEIKYLGKTKREFNIYNTDLQSIK